MALNTDFEWCGRPDIKLGVSNDTGDRIAIRDTISADVRAPAVVPVARRPGQSDLICLHVHPHIRFCQRLFGRSGVFEVGRNALTVRVT